MAALQKSLVLVTVDCLRADHAGFMGYSQPTTPFLDGLARESLVFPKAVVTGAPTYYSFPGILASRFPLGLGRDVIGIAPGEPTLATILRGSGYSTAALLAGNPYLSRRFGYHQGFQFFHDYLSEELLHATETKPDSEQQLHTRTQINARLSAIAHKLRPVGRLYDELYFQYCQRVAAPKRATWDSLRRFPAANVLVDQACAWLASLAGQPFFLWLHFMDPHAPYYPGEEALKRMGTQGISPLRARYLNEAWNRSDLGPNRLRKYRNQILRLYDAGIRWVDTQVARLAAELQQLSLWDSCALVVTADHGEEFLDHGERFHRPSRPHREMLEVPLLMRIPGVVKTILPDAPFSQIHLAPTLLDALGISVPDEFQGRSYLSEAKSNAQELAISESVGACTNPMSVEKRAGGRLLVVQDRRHKLVLDFEHGIEDLYDLETDPNEAHPAQQIEKGIRARLLQAALQHVAESRTQARAEFAIRARIQQLGLEWRHSNSHSEASAS